jgi:hypothetical protein
MHDVLPQEGAFLLFSRVKRQQYVRSARVCTPSPPTKRSSVRRSSVHVPDVTADADISSQLQLVECRVLRCRAAFVRESPRRLLPSKLTKSELL